MALCCSFFLLLLFFSPPRPLPSEGAVTRQQHRPGGTGRAVGPELGSLPPTLAPRAAATEGAARRRLGRLVGLVPRTSRVGARDGSWALLTATTAAREEAAAPPPNRGAAGSGSSRRWRSPSIRSTISSSIAGPLRVIISEKKTLIVILKQVEEKLFPFPLSYNRSMIGLFKLQRPHGSHCVRPGGVNK